MMKMNDDDLTPAEACEAAQDQIGRALGSIAQAKHVLDYALNEWLTGGSVEETVMRAALNEAKNHLARAAETLESQQAD